jgi:hypothetical protein
MEKEQVVEEEEEQKQDNCGKARAWCPALLPSYIQELSQRETIGFQHLRVTHVWTAFDFYN